MTTLGLVVAALLLVAGVSPASSSAVEDTEAYGHFTCGSLAIGTFVEFSIDDQLESISCETSAESASVVNCVVTDSQSISFPVQAMCTNAWALIFEEEPSSTATPNDDSNQSTASEESTASTAATVVDESKK